MSCGDSVPELFENARATLAQVIEKNNLFLVTDGGRSSGNFLFDLCQETIRTGQVGRPKTTLKEGVRDRVIHFGSQTPKK